MADMASRQASREETQLVEELVRIIHTGRCHLGRDCKAGPFDSDYDAAETVIAAGWRPTTPSDLTFVVSGYGHTVRVERGESLKRTLERALRLSQNVGQPVGAWEVRDGEGALLDLTRPASDFAHSRVFANPRAGVGG
jgi:hypothetical protein